jgi:hypothetical protein
VILELQLGALGFNVDFDSSFRPSNGGMNHVSLDGRHCGERVDALPPIAFPPAVDWNSATVCSTGFRLVSGHPSGMLPLPSNFGVER